MSINRKNILSSLILLSVSVFTLFFTSYFFIYLPMDMELKNETYNNHIIISEQKQAVVQHFIDRSIEGAKSLSNRMMILNAILDYKNDNMSFEELKEYTQSKYEDGFTILSNSVSASRVVDGRVVAEVNETLTPDEISLVQDIDEIQFDLLMDEQKNVLMRIISPIKKDGLIVGHDIMAFDMTPAVDEINDNKRDCKLLNVESSSALLDEGRIIEKNDGYSLLIKEKKVIFLTKNIFGTSKYSLSVEIPQDLLESKINALTLRSLLWSGFLVVASLGIGIWISFNNASCKIKIENQKSEYYQEKANRDALTNLYSRHFLEYAKSTFLADMTPLAVVMIDVNKFKNFNDTYGHLEGDKALISLASTFKKMVRGDDIVIRYGGDEFLFLLKYCDSPLCESIMKRVSDQVVEEFKGKDISIAYGYTITDDIDSLSSSIGEADKLMYENKRKMR